MLCIYVLMIPAAATMVWIESKVMLVFARGNQSATISILTDPHRCDAPIAISVVLFDEIPDCVPWSE
ncbi:hypothetical protein PVAP13_9NG404228 [Panicum virgatum]|uniref:Uncharacterized protein n=1 Tax=Panicum virgatum TaxID=38727 RepID=A0A8T0MUT4_PANVG|nr:hypothetical protein PVAP13_9NG404228 [Panicum virgatum]